MEKKKEIDKVKYWGQKGLNVRFNNALNIIFPPKCAICGKIHTVICQDCEKIIEKYSINLIKNECINIEKGKTINVEKFFIYKYEEIMRELLIKYKFNDNSFFAETFIKIMSKNKKMCRFFKKYDIIVPVPLSKKRRLQRGYNQTELIAKGLEKYIKVENNSLIKIKNTRPQSEKKAKDRAKDVKGVYSLQNIDKIAGKRLLIFDDIYTTGSTVNECIKELSKVTEDIGVLILAKDYMEVENGRFS